MDGRRAGTGPRTRLDGDPPLIAGRIHGVRTWSLMWTADAELALTGYIGSEWESGGGTTVAEHIQDGAAACPGAPAPDCACGLYGRHPFTGEARRLEFGPPAAVDELGPFSDPNVAGVIEAWGRVELHKGGFRAEYARPIALVVLEEWRDSEYGALVGRLAERYRAGVAYLHEPHELAAWCDERELGLSEPTVRSLLPAPALAQRAQRVEVVQTCGVEALPSETGWRTRLWEEWKPYSVGDAIGMLVGGVFGLFYLAFGAGIAYVIAAAIFGWLPEDDGSRTTDRPMLHGQRALEIVDEDLVREGKRRWLYLATVKNTGERAAVGVVPSGRLLDRNGERVASIGRPGDVEGGVNLAPGQTGAVWDEIRLHGSDPRSPSAVARIKVTAGARKLVEGAPRSPIAVRDVRPDHELCIVTATIDSRREMKRARLSLVGREHNGRLLGATKFGVGPLARGRGEYFVTRIPPRACAEPPLRLEGYPSLTTRQLRETASSR